SADVCDPKGDMASRYVGTRRIDMPGLIVEIKVRLESTQESSLVEAAKKHELVDGDVPVHERPYRALVRRRAARGDEGGAHLDRHVGARRRLQPMQGFQQRLERSGRQWL